MGGSPAIELDRVAREHSTAEGTVYALREFSLRVEEGELVAVMGPSGSGKSTLLNIIGGLARPTHGEVRVQNNVLNSMSSRSLAQMRRRHIGYIFQDYNLIPSLTALENVAMPLELDGHRPRSARAMALDSLNLVGLAHLGSRFPAQLSGGQQQRVAIARAVVGDRRLILADEPTGALDSARGEEILAVMQARCAGGATAVLVTHDVALTRFADRVVHLEDGMEVQPPGTPK